ncbi:ATP-dependent RNA helicase DBP8 [Patellaria atrata CBS 101060]|uniref:ATP-dependent RNA helicase DBP8 n=1 Tax=Patellaria atrata CBS 101060 TaxID=1346257 RepID=A0A9P4VMI0_9PEZI|nr:ATP-dependent RNA helicase DBP8 [Patellaria atrata CBS 101060]
MAPSLIRPKQRQTLADSNASESDSLIDVDAQVSRKRRKISPSNDEVAQGAKSIIPTASQITTKNTSHFDRKNIITDDNVSFASIGVAPWLIASLSAMAIKRPTGIQKSCIPEILKGRDCIGGSRTGSGKTVAFAVPILQKWAEDPVGIFAVVLTATRELALQIFEQFRAISAPQSLKPILITGGDDMRTQAIQLSQRPHIIIATPGRLADHIINSGEDTICGLRRVKFIVLDEADRLLASGQGSMLPDVETCLSVLPPSTDRQTCLFTATVTPEVRALKEIPRPKNRPPVFVSEVDTEELAIPDTLQQKYLQVNVTHKEAFLHVLLLTPANINRSVIIFCNRTNTANLLEHMLRLLEHRVTALHSKLLQSERINNLARFRAKAARILVATDVASRGLDIPEVALVINYDVPRDPDDYIHRCGRTARAGRTGEAVTLLGQRDLDLLFAIEERVGKKLDTYDEKDVNIQTRVIRDGLKPVGEKKREALIQIEEGRDVTGKRKKGMLKRVV